MQLLPRTAQACRTALRVRCGVQQGRWFAAKPAPPAPEGGPLTRGWRRHLGRLRDRPASHIAAFAILHEVTAVAPLFAVYYALDYFGPPAALPEQVLQEGNRYANKLRQYAGWEPLDRDSPVLAHLAASYAIVKAAAPLRIALCVALTPAAARWCVVPVAKAAARMRRWLASSKQR